MRATDPYPVVRMAGIRKEYAVGRWPRRARLTAVDGVDLDLRAGRTTALVGESGCGKSTLARCLTGLLPLTAGSVHLDGLRISGSSAADMKRAYRDVQMVFQDPHASLNPRRTVRATLEEPLRLQLGMPADERRRRVQELVEQVQLLPEHLDRRPHELSGGQRQRVGIARAPAVQPKVVVLDEPTSSLDVSVRGQIIELLERLQSELGLAYLFITHDLAVVRRLADDVAVMYLGQVVEHGSTADVFGAPAHPYTRALLSAAPVAEWGVRRDRIMLRGEIPSPIDLGPTCRLVGRCPLETARCGDLVPPLMPVHSSTPPGPPPVAHRVACIVTAADGASAVDGSSTSDPIAARAAPAEGERP